MAHKENPVNSESFSFRQVERQGSGEHLLERAKNPNEKD